MNIYILNIKWNLLKMSNENSYEGYDNMDMGFNIENN